MICLLSDVGCKGEGVHPRGPDEPGVCDTCWGHLDAETQRILTEVEKSVALAEKTAYRLRTSADAHLDVALAFIARSQFGVLEVTLDPSSEAEVERLKSLLAAHDRETKIKHLERRLAEAGDRRDADACDGIEEELAALGVPGYGS